ncbi:MAG: hypothetical protein IJ783_06485 [Kiritimatiellae bacterium]|nr:hypothetical protein [Kiritimatiellia bacterium]
MKTEKFRFAACLAAFAMAAARSWGAGAWVTSSWNSGFVPAGNNILFGKMPDSPSAAANALVRTDNGNPITEASLSYATLTDGDAGPRNKAATTCLPDNFTLAYDLGGAYTSSARRTAATKAPGSW